MKFLQTANVFGVSFVVQFCLEANTTPTAVFVAGNENKNKITIIAFVENENIMHYAFDNIPNLISVVFRFPILIATCVGTPAMSKIHFVVHAAGRV